MNSAPRNTSAPPIFVSFETENIGVVAAAGRHEAALERLLAAAKIQERDAVVWQRLGALALRTGRRHLARLALEEAISCSPHHQLAAMRLNSLLASLGDASDHTELYLGITKGRGGS